MSSTGSPNGGTSGVDPDDPYDDNPYDWPYWPVVTR
jgi:hypothetical protein